MRLGAQLDTMVLGPRAAGREPRADGSLICCSLSKINFGPTTAGEGREKGAEMFKDQNQMRYQDIRTA